MSRSELWMREYNEASKLGDDINTMVSEATTLPPTATQTLRHFSATRRKITIFNTKLQHLQSLLAKLPSLQQITGREINRRNDLLTELKSKVNQMESTLNSYSAAHRDRLLGSDVKSDDVMMRVSNMDNQRVLNIQRHIISEQNEGLEKLEETVISINHIALAVNEELNLHTRLLDTLDDRVETSNSLLQHIQRRLAIFNKRSKGGCTSLCKLVIMIVLLILLVLALIKYA